MAPLRTTTGRSTTRALLGRHVGSDGISTSDARPVRDVRPAGLFNGSSTAWETTGQAWFSACLPGLLRKTSPRPGSRSRCRPAWHSAKLHTPRGAFLPYGDKSCDTWMHGREEEEAQQSVHSPQPWQPRLTQNPSRQQHAAERHVGPREPNGGSRCQALQETRQGSSRSRRGIRASLHGEPRAYRDLPPARRRDDGRAGWLAGPECRWWLERLVLHESGKRGEQHSRLGPVDAERTRNLGATRASHRTCTCASVSLAHDTACFAANRIGMVQCMPIRLVAKQARQCAD